MPAYLSADDLYMPGKRKEHYYYRSYYYRFVSLM